MYLIACGVALGFLDHAGVYILKLCPWFSLELQDKMKQLPTLSLFIGLAFYFSSLGRQFGAVTAWEMFGVFLVVFIMLPALLYTAYQKRKATDAQQAACNGGLPELQEPCSIPSTSLLERVISGGTLF